MFLSECPSTCVAGRFQVFALRSPQFSGACLSGVRVDGTSALLCHCLCHLWRKRLMSSSQFCRRNQRICRATLYRVGILTPKLNGQRRLVLAFPATSLPCKNRRKRSWEEGLGHSRAVWGWTNTRVQQMREPKLCCSALRSFPCPNSWKRRNRNWINLCALPIGVKPQRVSAQTRCHMERLSAASLGSWMREQWLKKQSLNCCFKPCPASPPTHADIYRKLSPQQVKEHVS